MKTEASTTIESATPGPWVWSGNALLSNQAADYYSEPVMRSEEGAFAPNDADKALIAAAPDHALLFAAIVSGRARIEPLGRDVEICTGGLRYAAMLDESGCPVVTDAARAAIARAEGR